MDITRDAIRKQLAEEIRPQDFVNEDGTNAGTVHQSLTNRLLYNIFLLADESAVSLRDRFAMAAIPSIYEDVPYMTDNERYRRVAERSYLLADAMLKARENTEVTDAK